MHPQTLLRTLCACLAALLAAALPGNPQSPPRDQANRAGSGDRPPAILTATRLVRVSVVARDKHGQPITDLGRDDFRIFDDGKEQKIAFFSLLQTRPGRPVPASLPSGTWTNKAPEGVETPENLTLILLDGLNTTIHDAAYARQHLADFLSRLQPGDRVALYCLGSELREVQDFTSDSRALLQALVRDKPYNGPQIAEPGRDTLTDAVNLFLHSATDAANEAVVINRAYRTAAALEAIARHVSSLPGRKNLIWVSAAFPISLGFDGLPVQPPNSSFRPDDRNFLSLVEEAARALNDADMAIYPVDAAGLVAPINAATNTAWMRTPMRSGRPTNGGLTSMGTPLEYARDTMIALAGRTGGHAFYETNDVPGAIREVIDEGKAVYSLAYTPTHNEWNGKFRQIKVETRRSGVKLSYRQGYFALPDRTLSGEQSEWIAEQARSSPMNATEIRLTAHARRASSEGVTQLALLLDADFRDLRFEERDGMHAADLLLVSCHEAADGRTVGGSTNLLKLRLHANEYKQVEEYGLRMTVKTDLEAGARIIRLIVVDGGTGRVGSVDIPVADALSAAGLQRPAAEGGAGGPPGATEKPQL